MSVGYVTSIKELVVRVQFDSDTPRIGELVVIDNGTNTNLLVDHLEPGGIAFCLNVRSDKSIEKGMAVNTTGKGIEIPIGDPTIGRILGRFRWSFRWQAKD